MGWTLDKSTNVWRCTQYSDLDAGDINNFAEYGQPFDPYDHPHFLDTDVYAPDFAHLVIEMPQLEVMTNGYGKDLTAESFPIVKRFLNESLPFPHGTYTFNDLVNLGFATKDDRRIRGHLYPWRSGGNGFVPGSIDALGAAYVHGSVGAALMAGTRFAYSAKLRQVDAEIGALDDNWDFESGTLSRAEEALAAVAGPDHYNLEGPIKITFRGPGRNFVAKKETDEPEPADAGSPDAGSPDAGTAPPTTPSSPPPPPDPTSPPPADGSFAGKHARRKKHAIVVGPSTADQKNAIRPEPDIVACWRLDDIRFDFNSCFVRPEAYPDFRLLAALLKDHPQSVLSIFGHADPVGDEPYNKQLSGRRAVAVYAVLVRDVDKWESLYSVDHWGNPQVLLMLDALGYSPTDKDGLHTGKASDALKAFQSDNGLTAHGYINASVRKKLFKAYMDRLCGPGLLLDKKVDFLARGADPDGRGDIQGCSEFNPLLLLSKDEDSFFSKPANHTQRNAVNAPNRRVLVFLFRAGTKVNPADWPCPKADTRAITACEKRFWAKTPTAPGGRERLKPGDQRRLYAKGHKTFACRFYDRLSDFSPCENPGDVWVLRILTAGKGSIPNHKPLANEPYTLEGAGSGQGPVPGRTDANGVLRAPVVDNTPKMTLKIAGMTLTLNGGALHEMVDDNAIKERLYNMGYGDGDFSVWTDDTLTAAIKAFQKDHQLNETGVADDDTRDKVKEMHGS
jgi:hypothetical protein